MSEYTNQMLRVVVAQICQTIGWHSIQSTPLELLVDVLHKYLQEISRETYRHTELYGRTEPNLVDVGLAFRNLNINLSDIEEYINYVDCVGCNVDVPKYPVHKESNLNFLKPGSKEVLTRPVHIPEYLPPIYPEKEEGKIDELKRESSGDGTNVDIVSLPTTESAIFKKPENAENQTKRPKIFVEEEGRPTREISSVMMTSSGFISPAREGKLPDSKAPIIPEYKSPPPPPPLAAILPQTLPVANIDSKFDKKDKKKKSNIPTDKEQRKKEKLSKDSSKHSHSTNDPSNPTPEKLKPVKKQKNKQKHREHLKDQITDENHIQLEFNTSIRSEPMSFPAQTLPIPMDLEVKPKIDEVKLSCEPSKEKLNIFKKISTTKKEREDLSRSPNIFHDAHLLSSIPEGTTITPAPPIKHHQPGSQQIIPIIDDDQVICVDDEPGFNSEVSKNLAPPLPRNLLPPGTTIKAQTPKRPRKKAQQQQQQQQILDQSLPLNLSSEMSPNQNPINMVKKDLIQIPRLLYLSQKQPKEKKERKKPKAKESKKDLISAPPLQNPHTSLPSASTSFTEKNLRDSLLFKDFSLNPKLGKPDGILSSSSNPYVTPNFPNVQPPIPMFPFYPFPPRPGLIPNPGLFPPLPDNPAFNKFLPMMRFGNFGNMTKRPRLTLPYDDEPPPLPPIDTEKNYCNVAPLVPDSMKFQLSPTRLKSNKSATLITSEIMDSAPENLQDPGSTLSKQTKILNSPIEISDDENVRSSNEDKEEDGDKNSEPNDRIMGSTTKTDGQNVSKDEIGSCFTDDREEKGEKRKDKMHKKGKKEKEGKIKKKKDKKDKSKSKEKAEKKKEKDEKKDKVRKLKKEKKKDKLRALAYSAEESKVDSTNPDSSQYSTVPKLTLKIGLGNSPTPDSPEGRKMSIKSHSDDMTDSFDDVKMSSFDRRESSPELARISPLVTRPPKQKTNSKDKKSDSEECTSTTAPTAPPQPVSRGPGRPPKNSSHHHNYGSSSSSATATISGIASSVGVSSTSSTVVSSSTGGLSGSGQQSNLTSGANQNVQSTDAEGNQVWICPACGRVDDGTPMIGCDGCDAWYHWVCVGIQVPPDDNEDWYCRVCIAKKQEAHGADKKRKRKKKSKAT